MKNFIKSIPVVRGVSKSGSRLYYRALGYLTAPRVLGEIQSSGNEYAAALGRAIERIDQELSDADRAAIEQVETERAAFRMRASEVLEEDDGRTVYMSEACNASKPPQHARLIYWLVQELKPDFVVELGACLGLSSAYIGKALEAVGKGGRVVTMEKSPVRIRTARELHRRLGLTNVLYAEGLFTDTLAPILKENGPVDLAFIDGHHQYRPTVEYFELIAQHATPHAVFVFDDIRWSSGMLKAWHEIAGHERTGVAIDLRKMGITALRPVGSTERHRFPTLNGVLYE